MSELDELISLFLEHGARPPSPEAIAEISVIDQAVKGTKKSLQITLLKLEDDNRPRWELGRLCSSNRFDGTQLASFPLHDDTQFTDVDLLLAVHRGRYNLVAPIFEGVEGCAVEDGGIKSFPRAKSKLDMRRKLGLGDHCPDTSRVRIVVDGLARMDEAFSRLASARSLSQTLSPTGIFNHYGLAVQKKYDTPFRSVNIVFCGRDRADVLDRIATEVQLMTRRVRAVTELDHAFNVAKTLRSRRLKKYLHSLLSKASILDFRELAGT